MRAGSAAVSCLVFYDTLLKNVTHVITKRDSDFLTKCNEALLQNAWGFLLQNATVLLQNVIAERFIRS